MSEIRNAPAEVTDPIAPLGYAQAETGLPWPRLLGWLATVSICVSLGRGLDLGIGMKGLFQSASRGLTSTSNYYGVALNGVSLAGSALSLLGSLRVLQSNFSGLDLMVWGERFNIGVAVVRMLVVLYYILHLPSQYDPFIAPALSAFGYTVAWCGFPAVVILVGRAYDKVIVVVAGNGTE